MKGINVRSYLLGIASLAAIAALAYLGGLRLPDGSDEPCYKNLNKVGIPISTLRTKLEQNENGNKNLVFQYYPNGNTNYIDLRGWFYSKNQPPGKPWNQGPAEVELIAGGATEVLLSDHVLSSAVLYDKAIKPFIQALKDAESKGATHAIFFPKDSTAGSTRFINWKVYFGSAAELAAGKAALDTSVFKFFIYTDTAMGFSSETLLNPSPPYGYTEY